MLALINRKKLSAPLSFLRKCKSFVAECKVWWTQMITIDYFDNIKLRHTQLFQVVPLPGNNGVYQIAIKASHT